MNRKSMFNTAITLLAVVSITSWGTYLTDNVKAENTAEEISETKQGAITYVSEYAEDVHKHTRGTRLTGTDIIELANNVKENDLTLVLNLSDTDTLNVMGKTLGKSEGREFVTRDVFYSHTLTHLDDAIPLTGITPHQAALIEVTNEFEYELMGSTNHEESKIPLLTMGLPNDTHFKGNALDVYTKQEQGEFIDIYYMNKIDMDKRYLMSRLINADSNQVIGFYVEEWGGSLRDSPLAFDMYSYEDIKSIEEYEE